MGKFLKVLSKVLTAIFVVAVFFITGFVSVLLPSCNRSFYKWQFQKEGYLGYTPLEQVKIERLGTTDEDVVNYIVELDVDGLVDLMMHTLKYCFYIEGDLNPKVEGKTINLFREDEISHMKDVKNVFGGVLISVIASVIAVVVLIPIGLKKKKSYYENCRKIPLYTIIGIVGFFIVVGLSCAIAFDCAFEVFHQIIFEGNYAFESGIMIGMIGDIFYDLVPIILSIWIVLFGSFAVGLYFYNKKLKRTYQR